MKSFLITLSDDEVKQVVGGESNYTATVTADGGFIEVGKLESLILAGIIVLSVLVCVPIYFYACKKRCAREVGPRASGGSVV